jgi:hypothetical protein
MPGLTSFFLPSNDACSLPGGGAASSSPGWFDRSIDRSFVRSVVVRLHYYSDDDDDDDDDELTRDERRRLPLANKGYAGLLRLPQKVSDPSKRLLLGVHSVTI